MHLCQSNSGYNKPEGNKIKPWNEKFNNILYSNIFESDMTDSKTLETIVDALSSQTIFTDRKPVVVIDTGIATDENLKLFKKNISY